MRNQFSRNVSIHDARANKIFGTMKATRIHPNARPKINIYEENGEQIHQVTKGVMRTGAVVSTPVAPTASVVPAPAPSGNAPTMAAAATTGVAVVKVRKPTGNSINSLLQRFQQNGQALTGGQMPANGVPEQTQPKEAAPGVQIIEKNPAPVPAAPSAVPAAPPAPAMAVVDVGAINRAAQQQVPGQQAQMRPPVQQPMQPQMQQFQQMPPQQFGYYQQPYEAQQQVLVQNTIPQPIQRAQSLQPQPVQTQPQPIQTQYIQQTVPQPVSRRMSFATVANTVSQQQQAVNAFQQPFVQQP